MYYKLVVVENSNWYTMPIIIDQSTKYFIDVIHFGNS